MTGTTKVIGLATTMALVLAGCSLRTVGDVPAPVGGPIRATAAALRTFDACDPLLDELQELGEDQVDADAGTGPHAEMPVAGTGSQRTSRDEAAGPVAPTTMAADRSAAEDGAAAGSVWGGTNVQESGVDEPDTVKTNGSTLLALADGELRVVDLASGTPEALGSLPVAFGSQLLVDGTTALVLASSPDGMGTDLTTVDLSTPDAPTVREQVRLDGYLTNARMVDGMVRVVTTTGGPRMALALPSATRAAETVRRRNLDAVRDTRIDDWLPRFQTVGADGAVVADQPVVACDDVFVPEEPAGTNMINVVSVDLRAEELAPSGGASVVGVGETVYASTDRLYVTSSGWAAAATSASGSVTDVHQFSIAGREPAGYVASGRVGGWLLNQFSMSEHGDDLRVAVTDAGSGGTESSVVVLRVVDGELVEVGRVDGLGRGEQIRSVRFLGDVGYVVTFRQTDPLYTIDLSDPTAPRAVGELKIPGYSSYLHPAGDGLLIGIGQDATLDGRLTGLQLALFDVSDPAAPQQLHKVTLPDANSSAEGDHHAFLWWAEVGLAVVPVSEWAPPGFEGAVGFSVSTDGIGEHGRIDHGGGVPVDRVVVVDGRLVSLSAAGLGVTDPDTFAETAFLPFS